MSRRLGSRIETLAAALCVAGALFAALALASCATIGTGDPVVVRAEDVETNATSFLEVFLPWHQANSTHETPALYQAAEVLRKNRTAALATLHTAIPTYKKTKDDVSKKQLLAAIQDITKLIEDVKALWTPKGA